jgi:hypothetical protein
MIRNGVSNLFNNLKLTSIMKAVKRNFLVAEETIRFNEINHFQLRRYFNPSDFNLDNKLNLHFDYSEGLGAKHIDILAVYIDTSKNMKTYEELEFTEEFKLPFPSERITKKNKQSVSLKLNEDSKLLWKIVIQIRQDFDTLLHLSID